ncbi:ABC transporter permease [Paenibacillus sp. BC26]|uniref:ABC transporter permease n=1 Tax=Paenibacillus sp. BC26 TaxID=1881032 RepID=UPI0008EB8786|nr:ABC transporter permease subunit [Paenibacillus sp. BC26]SFT13306.1 putative spermidine/putrescine transport system permease protein [Paenibacillus sp. BC26]
MRRNNFNHGNGYYAVLLTIMILLFLLPLLPLLAWSFAQQWRFPDLVPTASLRAWHYVFAAHSQVRGALFHSLGLAIATSLLTQVVAYPAARALGLYVKRWNKTIRFMLIAPILIPGISIATGVHVLFLWLGLSDQWLGVLLSHLIPAIPYSIYVLYGFYAGYDIAYEKQLHVLGANRLQAFKLIELPLLLPALSVSVLFSFLISWSQYLFTVFIGGGSLITVPMLLFSALSSGDYSLMGALCMIVVLPALLLVIFSSRGVKKDRYQG